MTARAALRRAGSNLWQPLDVNKAAIGQALGGGDDEVNRALEQLLLGRPLLVRWKNGSV